MSNKNTFTIDISIAAENHLVKMLKQQKKGAQIRIFVSNPGTAYAECGICIFFPKSSHSHEYWIVKCKEFSIYIHQSYVSFLEDAKIDITTINKLDYKLTIKAPNIKKIYDPTQDNINLSLEERIRKVLKFNINPQLAMHGGSVTLIRITDDLRALIQFNGGCNGCSMAHYTIKEGIENALTKFFPELIGVYDVTSHQRGEHSYY